MRGASVRLTCFRVTANKDFSTTWFIEFMTYINFIFTVFQNFADIYITVFIASNRHFVLNG